MGVGGMFWLGGRGQHRLECNPENDDWTCCSSSNPCYHGEGDCDSDDECAGNLICGTNNCGTGDSDMDCCTTNAGTTAAGGFLWVGDNSVVDGSNWAPGFPVSG